MGLLTQPISCIGLPVVTVPVWGCDPKAPHLSIGVQLVAAPWREDLLLRVAHQLQQQGVVTPEYFHFRRFYLQALAPFWHLQLLPPHPRSDPAPPSGPGWLHL